MSDEPKSAAPSNQYAHIASRVFDQPLLIERNKLVAILNVLGPRLGFDAPMIELDGFGRERPDVRSLGARVERREGGYLFIDGSVAVVPVIGTLVQRSSWLTDTSGMQSYAAVERAFQGAIADPDVREIVLEIDSPGGEVAGAFDMADRMFAARGSKRMTAVASELATSAAYLIASAADEIVVPRTGYIGSIGVVATHLDYSKAMEKRGVAVTYVYAGARKIEGNPYEPLPESVRADWQAEIDQVYGLFVRTVARNRGMSEQAVRDTEAGIFMGEAGVERGLATRVASFAAELTAVRARAGAPRAPSSSSSVQADVRDARERIKAILACDEAKGRGEMAKHLALETDLDVDQARALLAKSQLERSPSKLDQLMQHFAPGIRSEEFNGSAEDAPSSPEEIFKMRAARVKGKH